MRDEHEIALATQARVSKYRRHALNADRRTSDEYRRTEGISRFEQWTFTGNSREETYVWIERTLRTYGYLTRSRIVSPPSTPGKISCY